MNLSTEVERLSLVVQCTTLKSEELLELRLYLEQNR